jgi:Flp pilus assembly pilin Flp
VEQIAQPTKIVGFCFKKYYFLKEVEKMSKIGEKFVGWFLGLKYDLKHRMEGASAVEYGIMVALIAAVIVTAVGVIGTTLNTKFQDVATKIGT